MLGSYTHPEFFKFSGYFIGNEGLLMRAKGIHFIEDVNVFLDNNSRATITWQKTGEWEIDPETSLMLVLEKQCLPGEECFPGYRKIKVLATDISCNQNIVSVNLSKYEEGTYRMIVAKADDPVIGNYKTFELRHKL